MLYSWLTLFSEPLLGFQIRKRGGGIMDCLFLLFVFIRNPRPKPPLTTVLILYANLLTAESFYYVKYGSSIIKSKVLQKTLSNEDIKTVCFGISIHVLSWRQQRHKCLCFHYWDFLTNFWRNNWRSIFDVVERLCYRFEMVFRYDPKAFIYIKSYAKTLIIGRLNLLKLTPLQNRWWCSITYRLQTYFLWV